MTTELDGVLNVRQIDVAGRAVIIDLPIEPRYAPNVFLNVTYVRDRRDVPAGDRDSSCPRATRC